LKRDLFVAGTEAGTNWDFNKYKNWLLSKPADDEKLPDPHFFDGKANLMDDLDRIVMTSFPRSGNSLLRAVLERVMGIVTGSDAGV